MYTVHDDNENNQYIIARYAFSSAQVKHNV